MQLVPLRRRDIVLGRPLPWCVYDGEGNLLLDDGTIIDNEEQLNFLLGQGLFREDSGMLPMAGNAVFPPAGPAPDSRGKTQGAHFNDMKLQPGGRLQLQRLSDLNQERHYAKYIGHVQDQSVLIKTPLVNSLPLPILEGEDIIVRAFSGQAAYAFTASVIRTASMPYPYFHLTYPASVRKLVIRKATRVRVSLPATVSRSDTAEARSVDITDLSVSGAMLDARDELGSRNDLVDITFTLRIDNFETTLNLQGVICSITGKTGTLHHGLEFVNLQPFERVLLQALVYQGLAESAPSVA
jgi:c-di-GMP-binding flagellar brake protein YcgR